MKSNSKRATNKLKIKPATQKQLKRMIKNDGSKRKAEKKVTRVGATTNVKARASAYKSEGYTGTMLVAPTTNQKQKENKLLESCAKFGTSLKNVQKSSNVSDTPGYVYAIKKN